MCYGTLVSIMSEILHFTVIILTREQHTNIGLDIGCYLRCARDFRFVVGCFTLLGYLVVILLPKLHAHHVGCLPIFRHLAVDIFIKPKYVNERIILTFRHRASSI